MKFNISKDWSMEKAKLEEGCESVEAGAPAPNEAEKDISGLPFTEQIRLLVKANARLTSKLASVAQSFGEAALNRRDKDATHIAQLKRELHEALTDRDSLRQELEKLGGEG